MYGKIFASMYDGTLASRGPWQALVTFQQMLVLADIAGIVDMTAEAIARRTTIPLEIIAVGIAALEQPDNQSRSDAEDGRRIVRLDSARPWGWRIVNHAHYRALRTAEERRDYMRDYQRRRREAVNNVNRPLTDVTNVNNVTHADADADAEASSNLTSVDTSPVLDPLSPSSLGQEPRENPAAPAPQPAEVKSSKRSTRMVPDDWQPSERLQRRIAEEKISDNLARGGTTLVLEMERFRSCTFRTPRSDWDRTWWNWLLTECKRINEQETRDERNRKARR